MCALYTPGVAFGDVDRLCPVTLFEMSYSKWGAKVKKFFYLELLLEIVITKHSKTQA